MFRACAAHLDTALPGILHADCVPNCRILERPLEYWVRQCCHCHYTLKQWSAAWKLGFQLCTKVLNRSWVCKYAQEQMTDLCYVPAAGGIVAGLVSWPLYGTAGMWK